MRIINENQVRKPKILITDDSEMNRAILTDMLEDDYEIIEAENGVQAVAAIQEHIESLSIVLLDIVMPDMDGFEVLNIMNRHRWIEDIPVIMISAERSPTVIERAYELGVSDFISRPFDAMIVRRRVVNTILLYSKQKKLVGLVAEQIYEKEKQNSLMIDILSHIVGFKNGESAQHVLHVRVLTDLILKALVQRTDKYDLSGADISCISIAASLHDIGKIGIPENILNKPGKLTDEEFEIMKSHSMIGAEILEDLPVYKEETLVKYAYQICRWHHERFDGRGYPDGLKGDDIPIVAQIVSVADVYDALTSERVYKGAYSHEQAVSMIVNGECGVFNPLILDCLRDIEDVMQEKAGNHTLFKTEMSETINMAEEMLRHKELTVSERTLYLLEQERIKNSFYAELSHEIQFEYSIMPSMVKFSPFGAQCLGVDEIIMNPLENEKLAPIINSPGFKELVEDIRATTQEKPIVKRECCLPVGGTKRWYQIAARSLWPTASDVKNYTGVIGKAIDIHDSRMRLDTLERMAMHDALTGLYNHANAKKIIAARMKEHPNAKFALMMMDLDYFKEANDNYGHSFGDQVLVHLADKIRQSIRGSDIAARVGGDEFLIFLEYKTELEPIIKRIFSSLTGKYMDFPISLSIGVATLDGAETDYEDLFHRADQALYAAKQAGRGSYYFYDDSIQNMLSSITPIESDGDKEQER